MPPKRKAKSPKRAAWFPSPPKPKRMRLMEPRPPASEETRQTESRPPTREERPQTVVPEDYEDYSSSDSSSCVSTIYNVLPQPPKLPQPPQPPQSPHPPRRPRRSRNVTSYPCGYYPGAELEIGDDEYSPAATQDTSAGEGEPGEYDDDSDAANAQPDDDDNAEYYSASSSEESSSSEDSTSHSSPEHQPSSPGVDSPGSPGREKECVTCGEVYSPSHFTRRGRAKDPIRKDWYACNTCVRKEKRMGKETFDRLYGRGSEVFVDASGYSGSEYDEDSEEGYSDGSEGE